MNHTPGPWSVFNPRTRTNPSSEHRLLVLHPDGERIVARMDEGFVNGKGTMTIEEREANASLIAAAPDMLAVLAACITADAQGITDRGNAVRRLEHITRMARWAMTLAKTGKSTDNPL